MSQEDEPHTLTTMDEATTNLSFIGGGPSGAPPHRLWLRPPEHRSEETHYQQDLDPAREIQLPPPGMKPNTGIKPKNGSSPRLLNPTTTRSTMYNPCLSYSISFILLSPVYFTRIVYFTPYYNCAPLDTLILLFTANW
jgi:hypothetical protein